jgi:transcriptional regulator of acetoin/glycerol metabolism
MSSVVCVVATLDQVQAEQIAFALEAHEQNMTAAARALGIDRRTLYRMIERHGLQRPAKREWRRSVSHATDHV